LDSRLSPGKAGIRSEGSDAGVSIFSDEHTEDRRTPAWTSEGIQPRVRRVDTARLESESGNDGSRWEARTPWGSGHAPYL
jgi:hypothetical protein